MSARFDAIIIGAGQAGPALAGRLTAAGQKVALIERKLFGGTCVNTGCTPTKTLVASAYAAHLTRRAGDYGVAISGAITIDMAAVKARKDAVVAKSRDGIEGWLKGMAGCTVFEGHARFTSPHDVQVGDVTLSADRVFINVGGRPIVPDMPGVAAVKTLTNRTILELDTVPDHLVIVGGSYIGLEFAQIFRRFGSTVTVVEKASRLIPREDEDVSAAVKTILEAEGIAMRLDAACIHFTPRPDGIGVGVDCTAGEPEILASHVLLAMGRRPNTDDLGLPNAGVALDARGFIVVDDELRTSVPHIFAMGDCNGKGAFTHTAYNDFEIIAANLLDGEARRVSARPRLRALYRSTARSRRPERARGACVRSEGPGRHAADDAGEPRNRKRRDAGLHEDRRRCGKRSHSRCRDPRCGRRRGDPRRSRHDERQGALQRDALGGADPPDGLGIDPEVADGAWTAG